MLLLFRGINFMFICQFGGSNYFRQDGVDFQLRGSPGFCAFYKALSFYSSQDETYGP